MTYHIAYVLTDGHRDSVELVAPDIAEAEERAEHLLTRYFGQSWRIVGVRSRSGLILA